MANKYKYSRTIVIGHKDDGTPIRKYIQDNNKARFEAKVRAVQMRSPAAARPARLLLNSGRGSGITPTRSRTLARASATITRSTCGCASVRRLVFWRWIA